MWYLNFTKMSSKIVLEICANSVDSALMAQKGGAQRVELCDNIYEGGTTPSYGAIQIARKKLNIELNIIIRPRGGDFCYSDLEFEIMQKDIVFAKENGLRVLARQKLLLTFSVLIQAIANGPMYFQNIILNQIVRPGNRFPKSTAPSRPPCSPWSG